MSADRDVRYANSGGLQIAYEVIGDDIGGIAVSGFRRWLRPGVRRPRRARTERGAGDLARARGAMTRMFVAVYPPKDAIEDLDSFLEPRREAGDFRWSPTAQIHMTLAFLVEVSDRVEDDLVDRLAQAARKRQAMTASIGGGGAFPRVDFAKVLWAGLQVDNGAELDLLAANCRAAAAKAGAAPSGERFSPHLTVARMRRPIEATKWVRLLDAYRGPSWRIDEVALVESHLGEGPNRQPRHDVIATFRLREGSE